MMTPRRIAATLAVATAAVFSAGQFTHSPNVPTRPAVALATKGQCNPAPDPFNVQQQSKGNGDVLVWIAYGWDGVSVYPDCHGPLVGARTQNTSLTTTWYVHVLGRRGQPRTVAILPNSTKTYSAAQLSSAGLDTIDDISDLTLTTSP